MCEHSYHMCQMSNIWHLVRQTPKILKLGVLNAKIFGIDEQCYLKFGSILFTNCKTFIFFLFAGGHRQVLEFFFFFPFFNQLFPLSSLLSHLTSLKLSLLYAFISPSSLSFSSSLILNLLCQPQAVAMPPNSPEAASHGAVSPGAALPRAADLSLSLSLSLLWQLVDFGCCWLVDFGWW